MKEILNRIRREIMSEQLNWLESTDEDRDENGRYIDGQIGGLEMALGIVKNIQRELENEKEI